MKDPVMSPLLTNRQNIARASKRVCTRWGAILPLSLGARQRELTRTIMETAHHAVAETEMGIHRPGTFSGRISSGPGRLTL